jgi:hypothetical protein
VIIIFIETLLS